MPKNDNAHSLRLLDSLRKNCGDDVAEEFAQSYPLSKSANIEKKFKWAEAVCGNFSKEDISVIRNVIVRVSKGYRKHCRKRGVCVHWEMRGEYFRKYLVMKSR